MQIELLDESLLPEGFQYPESFLRVINLNLIDLDLWYVMDKKQMIYRYEGIKKRYPNRVLIPFARRDDNDDIACFELNKGDEVQIVHDFASAGFEQKRMYNTFWDWFRAAIEEMINFD